MQNEIPSFESIKPVEIASERIEKYRNLTDLESYALFMGKAQILEFGLKNLLIRRFGLDKDGLERWTLGRTAKALKEKGLRDDFICLLQSVVEYRNYIAHEFLLNEALLQSLLDGESGRLEMKHLTKGTFELEQLLVIFDWCEVNNGWY